MLLHSDLKELVGPRFAPTSQTQVVLQFRFLRDIVLASKLFRIEIRLDGLHLKLCRLVRRLAMLYSQLYRIQLYRLFLCWSRQHDIFNPLQLRACIRLLLFLSRLFFFCLIQLGLLRLV